MGYSEQINGFPQLSLSGIPSTKEQIWNGLTAGTPWQGVSWQQAEMEHNDAQTSGGTIPYETIPSRSELLGTDDYYAAQDETQVSTPLIQSHEYNTYGHRDGRSWVWWDENGNRHSRPIPEYITADTRTDWQRERDQKEFERRAAAEQQAKNEEEAAVAARALFGFALPSTYIGPLFNNNGESYFYNVVTQQGSGNEAGDFVIDAVGTLGSGVLAKGGRHALNLGTNAFTKGIGRTSWRPALRLETQPLRIGTQPLSTESQVLSFNPYPRYIKKSKGYAPNNLEALEAELEGLLDPTTHVVYVRDILGKYPQFDELLYRIPTNDQRAIARIPITLNKYKNDALETLYGVRFTNPKDATAFSGFKLSNLGLQPWKDSTGIGYPLDRIGVVSINLDNFKGLMPNPNMPLDLGQVLAHEFSHVITLNNPMHLQLLKFSPETNAKAKGISYEDFINSDFITQQGFKEYLANPQEYKGGINEAISQCGNRIWNYFFSKGETEQLARLSQLKSFVGDQSPYYLKTYTTNWNKSKFKTVDDLKRAFQLYLTQNPDNTMSTYYNILELGGNTAWENALQQINHWAPVLVPGAVGAGVVLGNSDDESSSDIDDDI